MSKEVVVTGTQTIKAAIKVTQEELLKALWKSFGLDEVYESRKCASDWFIDFYYKRTEEGLIKYQDTSYHGSACYEPSGIKITDPVKLKQYDLLVQLEETLKTEEE